MSAYAKCEVLNHTVEFKMIPTSGNISVGVDGLLVGNYPSVTRAMFEAAEQVRVLENLRTRPSIPEEAWEAVEEFVPPPPVMVEVASCDETIRICGGLEEFAGMEHTAIHEACEAYHRAATDSIMQSGGRLNWCVPSGKRVLHSQWMGARWEWSRGAVGTMTTGLTSDECAAIDAEADAAEAASNP